MHMNANELFASVGEPGGTGYAPSRASLSAFGLGDYSEALRLARAGYNALAESNHRWGLIVALCRIGFAALALGDLADARERFGSALRAEAAQSVSLELLALSGIGACLAEDPRRAGAGRRDPHVRDGSRTAASVLRFRRPPGPRSARSGAAARPARSGPRGGRSDDA